LGEPGPNPFSWQKKKWSTHASPISYHKGYPGSWMRDGPPMSARQIFFRKGT
jgi:hypothetical protein